MKPNIKVWGTFAASTALLVAAGCANSTTPPSGDRSELLDEVESWLYLIDVNLDSETVNEIAESGHDMVVLDFISSEAQNSDYPMDETIDLLHEAEPARLVLAYIDIGQAEDYRSYWHDDWQIGNPDWIVSGDPDGWEGNYPVAYWHDDWQDIWIGQDGQITQIVAAGFDGVYLDWVEAYDDDQIQVAADNDGVDALDEMVDWVESIAEAGRSSDPDFLVIGQNAAYLAAENTTYSETIDAVAQEQVWFDGAADNDPPGDCALPRTDDDVDTPAYEASLDEQCLNQYLEFPDSTLHVSSEEYLVALDTVRATGMPIFTVDYANDPDNVTFVLEESREHNFVPFVGSRALDEYVAPR